MLLVKVKIKSLGLILYPEVIKTLNQISPDEELVELLSSSPALSSSLLSFSALSSSFRLLIPPSWTSPKTIGQEVSPTT